MMMMMVAMESPPPPPLDNGVRQTQTTTTTTDDSDDHHCLETSKRSFSACTLSLTDSDRSYSSTSTSTTNDQQFSTGYFERKSYRPFRSNEEYLIAMKEDLAEWLNTLYGLDLTCDNFLQRLETGVILCQHANSVLRKAREWRMLNDGNANANATNNGYSSLLSLQSFNSATNSSSSSSTAMNSDIAIINDHQQQQHWSSNDNRQMVPIKLNALPGTFQSRDNVANFIEWCRRIQIHECLLFETEDLVGRKNEKSFILCLLEVARYGAKFGVLAPTLVQFEQEIDQEIEKDQQQQQQQNMGHSQIPYMIQQKHPSGYDIGCNIDDDDDDTIPSQPQQQIINNDLESLHEKVVNLLSRCTCPVQFYLEHLSEGKYRIGDTRTLIFVRILRNHVMVRVGGGWDTLEHYLEKHDPCRCRFGHHRNTGSARVSLPYSSSNLNHVTPVHQRNQSQQQPQSITMQVTLDRPDSSIRFGGNHHQHSSPIAARRLFVGQQQQRSNHHGLMAASNHRPMVIVDQTTKTTPIPAIRRRQQQTSQQQQLLQQQPAITNRLRRQSIENDKISTIKNQSNNNRLNGRFIPATTNKSSLSSSLLTPAHKTKSTSICSLVSSGSGGGGSRIPTPSSSSNHNIYLACSGQTTTTGSVDQNGSSKSKSTTLQNKIQNRHQQQLQSATPMRRYNGGGGGGGYNKLNKSTYDLSASRSMVNDHHSPSLLSSNKVPNGHHHQYDGGRHRNNGNSSSSLPRTRSIATIAATSTTATAAAASAATLSQSNSKKRSNDVDLTAGTTTKMIIGKKQPQQHGGSITSLNSAGSTECGTTSSGSSNGSLNEQQQQQQSSKANQKIQQSNGLQQPNVSTTTKYIDATKTITKPGSSGSGSSLVQVCSWIERNH
ncbi:Growth-Arrest-Specific Protein 2 Domain [Dermatophagoides pteronyssinus]|uniref:Growth-Arrest-Specific Protein 2 Domain n=1 Tax=Dermatophagoides pteronyssinus TaxID=6956 RepID=A0ABQ8IVA5_DERPT|nr:Growth-Arrest-Specific Protein 2 Domain [Dermatophagoides pteronyssinus]